VRFGQQQLGIEPGFMAKLVSTVVSHMKSAFPEIEAREKYVVEVIRKEEETFNRTVKKGIRKFKQVTSKMKPGDVLSGEDAYKLWSTFGFPKELTELMIEEVKMKMCTEESWNNAYVVGVREVITCITHAHHSLKLEHQHTTKTQIQDTTRDLTFRTKSGRSYGYEVGSQRDLGVGETGCSTNGLHCKVRGVRARSARIFMISFFLVSIMLLKAQEYHSHRSLIPQENQRSNVHMVTMNT